jgi:two-component system response regulator NreC
MQASDATAEPDTAEISVVLADDHAVVRSGLRMLLEAEPDIEVLAEAADIDSTARYVLGHKPTVLVLDLNMGPESSLPTIPDLLARSPDTAIVVLTMQDDPAFAREALRAGALGYVLKHAAGEELIQAVRLAASGQNYLNPTLGAKLASAPTTADGQLDGLTGREIEVLRLIALGHTNAQIAEQLFLSVRTIETHRAHIQQKTRRSSRPELVRYAMDNGLVS